MLRNHNSAKVNKRAAKGSHHAHSRAYLKSNQENHKFLSRKNIKNDNHDAEPLSFIMSVLSLKFDFNQPSHVLLFFLLGISYLPHTVDAETIVELKNKIAGKTIRYNDVSEDACIKVQDKIVQCLQNDKFNHEHIRYALNQSQLQIVCTNRADGGVFYPEDKAIHIPVYPIRQDIIRHEFMHAFNFFYHKNGKCTGKEYAVVSPVYPRTKKEIQRYHHAFDRGDARLQSFLAMVSSKITLDEEQKKVHDSYKKALNGYSQIYMKFPATEDEYQILYSATSKTRSQNIKVVSINKIGDKYAIEAITANIKSFITILLDTIGKYTYSSTHNDGWETTDDLLIHLLRIAEREAHIIQSLPQKAIELIYPEVNILHNEYLAKCGSLGKIPEMETCNSPSIK